MPKPAQSKEPLASLVDELGDIRAELEPFRGKIAREQALEKLLRAASEDYPATQQRIVSGTRWDVVLGPRTNKTSVNIIKLLSLVKAKVFNAIVSCTVASLERNKIAPEIIAQVIETDQSGYRPLNVFKRTPVS